MTSSQMLDSLKNPPTPDDVDSSVSEDDDEEQILETGREGRWQKNNQQVKEIIIILIIILSFIHVSVSMYILYLAKLRATARRWGISLGHLLVLHVLICAF